MDEPPRNESRGDTTPTEGGSHSQLHQRQQQQGVVVDNPDPTLSEKEPPQFKDQARLAGFEADDDEEFESGDDKELDSDGDEECGDGGAAATATTFIPWVESVRPLSEEVDGSGYDSNHHHPAAQISQISLPTLPASQAVIVHTPSAARSGDAQQVVLRKHIIWAGAFLLAVAIIAVVVLATITMSERDGSASGPEMVPSDSTPLPTVPPRTTTQVPTTLPPAVQVIGAPPSLLPTDTALTKQPDTLGPSTDTPMTTPPSTVVPTESPTVSTTVNPVPQSKLVASDGAADASFGFSVAIDGDTVVVGADWDDTENGIDSGSVYVYTRSENAWTEQTKLIASDGAPGNHFGISVAIDNNTMVTGAWGDDTENGERSGSAYVYTLSGTVWTEQAKLSANDGAANDRFGINVAINGDTLVIGAYLDETENGALSGSAYVYTLSGTVWTEQAKLTASDGAASDYFGRSVAIDGDTIVIGAHRDDTESGDRSGSAFVYTRLGTVWTEQAKITASDGAAGDEFGWSVAIDGDTVVIGAYYDDTESGTNSGSAYVFTRQSGILLTEQVKLTASDGALNDWFGRSVTIGGETLVIGASYDDTENGSNSGSAYVYTFTGTVWTQQTKFIASDGAAADEFGRSMAIDGDTIIIGAYLDDTENGSKSGSVYIFQQYI